MMEVYLPLELWDHVLSFSQWPEIVALTAWFPVLRLKRMKPLCRNLIVSKLEMALGVPVEVRIVLWSDKANVRNTIFLSDVDIIARQVQIPRPQAAAALCLFEGDLVDTIIDLTRY